MNTLSELQQCQSIGTLKSKLHTMCARFGRVNRLDVLTATHEGAHQAICFLRMETPSQDEAVMQALSVGRFGGEIAFVLKLNEPAPSKSVKVSSEWADLGVQ